MINYLRTTCRAKDLLKSASLANYVLLFTLLLSVLNGFAQQSALSCNTVTNWTAPTFSTTATFTQTSGHTGTGLTNAGNITDNDAATGATLTLVSRRFGTVCTQTTGADVQVDVKDASNNYNGGNYVGIITSKNPLTTFDSFSITLLDASGNTIGSALTPIVNDIGGGNYQVGVITPTGAGTFRGIRISATLDAPAFLSGCSTRSANLDIRSATQVNYCAGVELACNTRTNPSFPAFNVSVSNGQSGLLNTLLSLLGLQGIVTPENLITASTSDYAAFRSLAGVDLSLIGGLLTGERYIAVTDNVNSYPAGTFAGFVIENNNLLSVSLLSNYRVELWSGNAKVQDVSGAGLMLSGGLLTGTGPKTIGLVANQPFNQVRLVEVPGTLGLSVAAETRIYNAVFRKFCEADALVCNTPVKISDSNYPVMLSTANTGISGTIGVNNNILDTDNLLNAAATQPAQIVLPVGVASTGTIAVKKELSDFPAGAFIGFDVSRPVLAGVGLLQGFKIKTFKGGTPTSDEVSANALISVNTSILSGVARQTIGFVPTQAFDEIQLIVEQTGVTLGTTSVYSMVIQKFCASEDPLACNNPTMASIPANPVYINAAKTGVDALLCAGCSINDSQNVIDGSASTYASVILAAGVAVDATLSMANAIETYPAKSFVGFEIGTATLLSADVLSAIEIRLYNDGSPTPVQTISSAGMLLSATTSLLDNGLNRQLLGVVSNVAFDEAQIVFKQPIALDLGTIRIYGVKVTGSCPSPTISCNSSYYLNQTAFPVYVNPARTGASGIASVSLGGVKDTWNVVSASTTDYALLTVNGNADVLAQASISVRDALNVYPSGTVAGFTIEVDPSLINVDLLTSMAVETYLDGAPAGSSANLGNLIDLELLGLPIFGTGSGFLNVGFVTNQPFNEIRIVAKRPVSASVINEIKVYGSFVDTRTSTGGGSLSCLTIYPDVNVAYINKPVTGDVRTNDVIGSGLVVAYGTAVGDPSNPTTEVPTIAPDGSYTFVATEEGVYVFTVPACPAGQTTDCPAETLTITVLDLFKSDNPPVANADLATMSGSQNAPVSPALIDVVANDKAGNSTGSLNALSIKTSPTNGTATIVSGKVQYTPNAAFYGTETFTYEICESPSGLCREAQVVVNVLPPGASSVIATDDYDKTAVNTTLSVPATGVLNNDWDAAGGNLAVASARVSKAAGSLNVTSTTVSNAAGTVTFEPDGSYTYVPQTGFEGTGVFPYTANNTGGMSASATLYISVFDPNSLPVKLVSFAISKEGESAHLSWATSEEQNSDRFEVERSLEGKSWHKLGTVEASGNTSTGKRYSYLDAAPAEGLNYYRLRIVDKDGTFAHSPIKSASFKFASEIIVTPNPAVEVVKLKVRDAGNVEKVELISTTGQVLYRSGANPLKDISVRHLPSGVYMLNVTRTGGRISSHKVLKN